MSYLRLYGLSENNDKRPQDMFAGRSELIRHSEQGDGFDVIVVGGGIHGASFARLAAFNGLSVLLLERDDYASATSSRSSKMAHGGLRYLEMYDFAQVFEGIKAREDLFKVAPHLVSPGRFLIPVDKRDWYFRYKLKLGLILYDLFVAKGERRHRWRSDLTGTPFESKELLGAFSYVDGILDDARLVLENITAAKQEGACCLNYAEVLLAHQQGDRRVSVKWRDILTGDEHETSGAVVVNCAGPWVAEMGRLRASSMQEQLKFSRGSHLLFHTPWNYDSLFLPMEEKGRYYFVWPHFAGTMVGTTEREVTALEVDPQPSVDEVDEILQRLERDLPGSGLDRSTLHYGFAGVRTLPLRERKGGAKTGALSRKHIWSFQGGVLSLLGGKLTTAAWTAFEGLKFIYKLAQLRERPVSLQGRPYPGHALWDTSMESFGRWSSNKEINEKAKAFAISRFGSRVRFFEDQDYRVSHSSDEYFSAMVDYAVEFEQAESVEDIMRRRLGFEYLKGHGLSFLPEVEKRLQELKPERDFTVESARYRERLSQLHITLRGESQQL